MSWTTSAFIGSLASRLEAEDAFAGVKISTAPINPNSGGTDNLVFLGADGRQEWAALGAQSRNDAYTVQGVVFCFRSGTGDQKATEAREAAATIMDSLAAYLTALVSSDDFQTLATDIGATQITNLTLARLSLVQGTAGDKRAASIEFDIEVNARV